MLKVSIEKKVCRSSHKERKGRRENITERSAVLYQWQAYFYPTQYHAYSGAVLEHSDCVQSWLQSTNKDYNLSLVNSVNCSQNERRVKTCILFIIH